MHFAVLAVAIIGIATWYVLTWMLGRYEAVRDKWTAYALFSAALMMSLAMTYVWRFTLPPATGIAASVIGTGILGWLVSLALGPLGLVGKSIGTAITAIRLGKR